MSGARGPEHDRQVFELLAEAGGLEGSARESLLAAAAPEVAEEVRAMLAAEIGSSTFLRTADHLGPARIEAALAEDRLLPGTVVGPYRVLGDLGAGGMGFVYLAEQSEPIERRVALKLLRVSFADPEARRRFEREREAMARLEHPNIGRILDAGTTEDGTAYLAMELIDGQWITVFCDARRLSLRDRVGVMVPVCRAVDYAHRKLLLHRDIKPSNVLVTEIDGQVVPKLIDFGIAKTLDIGAPGLATRHQILGTPDYMSPEAFEHEADLDTRSDVFSLGVLLHQLLAGALPWAGEGASLASLLQRRASDEAERMSVEVSQRGPEQLARLASLRSTTPGAFIGDLRSDLDWVVLRALARRPANRYASAGELAADLERVLADEPVAARQGHRAYVARKTLRRHRKAALAAAAVLLALTAGIIGTSTGLLRARAAEAAARQEARRAAEARDEAEAVTDYLRQILSGASFLDPSATRSPSEVTAAELLELATDRIEERLADQPRVLARVEQTIGRVYKDLEQWDKARALLSDAADRLATEQPPDPERLADAVNALAMVELARGDREAARVQIDRALAALDEGGIDRGEARESTLILAARLARSEGRADQAIDLLRRAIEITAADSPNRGVALTNLGSTYFQRQQWGEAERCFRESLELFEAIRPEGHVQRAHAADNLAAAIASQGRLEEAAPLFETALADRRRVLGDHHLQVASSLNNLGALYLDLHRPEQAEPYHRQALAIRREQAGEDNPVTAWSYDNLARAVGDQGRIAEAQALQRRALEIREATNPRGPEVVRSLSHLASLAVAAGDDPAALSFARRALEVSRAAFDPGRPQIGRSALALGEVELRLGDRSAAKAHLTEAVSILEASSEAADDSLAAARAGLAALEDG